MQNRHEGSVGVEHMGQEEGLVVVVGGGGELEVEAVGAMVGESVRGECCATLPLLAVTRPWLPLLLILLPDLPCRTGGSEEGCPRGAGMVEVLGGLAGTSSSAPGPAPSISPQRQPADWWEVFVALARREREVCG